MARNQRYILLVLVAVGQMVLAHGTGYAAPEARLIDGAWDKHDESSLHHVDHTVWDRLLRTYVVQGADGINRFRYQAVGAGDMVVLDAYINAMAQVRVGWLTRAEQKAFWINLYNAATVQTVLRHYPVGSIRDIGGGFVVGPWRDQVVEVLHQALSLDDIEHGILRPIWRDARVHYAVNCAAIGCPNLVPAAYTAKNIEVMLEQSAHDYVNHPRGARVDAKGRLEVSRIYKWYRVDFGDSVSGVIAHLKQYADPLLQKQLEPITKIRRYRYDWDLNDAR